MFERETPTRAEIHRMKYHATGGACGRLPFSQLTEEERSLIEDAVLSEMVATPRLDELRARVRVLQEWGIATASA